MHAFGIACVLLASSASILSQETTQGPDGDINVYVPGVDVLEVAGIPFTATSNLQWIRTLADGTTVKRQLTSYIARDSSGRVYREKHHFVAEGSSSAAPLYETEVYDPLASSRTSCTVASRKCVITSYRARTSYRLPAVGPLPNGAGVLTRDTLGTKTMEGLNVEGTIDTRTWNPGAAGNDRSITSTKELWYSEELRTNLAVTRNDPALGQQVITLNNVSRSEPEASQFAVPQGYTVLDERERSHAVANGPR